MDDGTEKKLFMEFVRLTEKEYNKLIDKIGLCKALEMIERLNDYIGQIGEKKASKKYVSHYYTILNWVRKDGQNNGQVNRPESQSIRGERGRNKSFHERDVEEARVARQSTRLFFRVHRGGVGLVNKQNERQTNARTENSTYGDLGYIPQMEITKT